MSEQVSVYVKNLERQKKEVEGEIACRERTLSRINQKLQNPEKYLAEELKRGSVKVSKLFGKEVAQKPKTLLKRKSEGSGAPDAPAALTHDVAILPEEREENRKPSTWSLFG